MKIIKNTMKEPTEITCPFCNSVLAYTFEDIRREEKQDGLFPLMQNSFVHRFIVCPVCKRNIDLDPTVVLMSKPQKKGGKV